MRDIGLVLFDSSWGEVDWILPVLVKLKELEPDLKLSAVFNSPELWAQRDSNLGLLTQMDKVIDSYTIGTSLSLDLSKVRFVLKDFRGDNLFKNQICSSCRGAKIIVYPHATGVHIAQPINASGKEIWETRVVSHDLMVVPTEYDVEWWSLRLPNPNLKVAGFPRYDDWWIRTLTTCPEFLRSKEHEVSTKYNVVTFTTRGPHVDLSRLVSFPREVHDYLVHSTAEVVLEDPNNFLIVRPHPRQNPVRIRELRELLAAHDRWMFTQFQALQIASLSSITITMSSSCAYDSLAAGTPLIEFYQFTSADEGTICLKDGSLGAPCTFLGLTLPVKTKEELRSAFHSNYDEFYQRERKNFLSLMVQEASELVASAILE